ncbi:MAG: dihydropteroate synthase [Burkholderiales bacterium]
MHPTNPPVACTHWQTTRFLIDLSRPRVMGIVNVTPDSFSDGGQHDDPAAALQHCEKLVRGGADLLDIGGESTRPGSAPVPLDLERHRVLPVLRAALTLGVPISVDTYKAELMQDALDLGADVINDVWALRQPGALQAVAGHPACGVVLMHMQGEPATMQRVPMACDDAPGAVACWLAARANAVVGAGVARVRIVLDPGIGFGKTIAQNYALLAQQQRLLGLGSPILAGWSAKSSLGAVTGLDPQDRMVPSVAAALLAVERGARIVRVHDVADTVAALAVWNAMQAEAVP